MTPYSDRERLAAHLYDIWAEGLNVPPWRELPDFRRHRFRRMADVALAWADARTAA